MDTMKSVFLIVGVLILGLLLGSTTGQAVRKIIGGGGDSGCSDADNDRFFGQTGCGTSKDCNDNNPYVYPSAEEICGNNLDDDCVNGDIGLCNVAVYIQTGKDYYYENEGVLLK